MLTLPAPHPLLDRRGRLAVRPDGIPYRQRPLERIVGVALHATDAATSAESLALYQATKVEGDPYPAIAYHYVVHADGTIEWCQDLDVETWHAGAAGSAQYLAVCLAGAWTEARAPDAQLAAGRALVAALSRQLGRALVVRAHRELMPIVACPGPRWSELRDALTPTPADSSSGAPSTSSPAPHHP